MTAGGIVLCGGRSSRMGRPKALLPFGDEVLLQRVVRVLRGVVDPVVVVAAPGQELPDLGGILIARDDREFLGPLNGLAAGLAALDGRADVAYASACDAPFLTGDFIRRVLGHLEGVDVAMPDVGGLRHPLAAGYRLSVRPAVRALLDRGSRRLLDLTDVCRTRLVAESELIDLEPLRNLNTPEEYAACGAARSNAAGGRS